MCLGSARGQVCSRPSGEGVIIEPEVLSQSPSPPTLAKGLAVMKGGACWAQRGLALEVWSREESLNIASRSQGSDLGQEEGCFLPPHLVILHRVPAASSVLAPLETAKWTER